jgi:hypothetical protein
MTKKLWLRVFWILKTIESLKGGKSMERAIQERADNVLVRDVYSRMMQDNRHYKAEKVGGFWQFVTKNPPEDYEAKHRPKFHGLRGPVMDKKGNLKELMMNCKYCHMYMEDQEIELDTASMRKLLETAKS